MRHLSPFAVLTALAVVLTAGIPVASGRAAEIGAKRQPTTTAPDDTTTKVVQFTLSNGLKAVVIPTNRAPVVTHMIWYKVGAADEPPGKSGLAHFLEHLMFKGTHKHPAGEFSQVVADMGGQENAFTTQDYTAFYQRVPANKLGTVMAFEADRMTGLVLTQANVKPELQVVLEEQNMRIANRPAAQFDQQIEAALFLNSPYGTPTIGWRPEIEKLTLNDAMSFYRHWYTPNNAILVVAGDVDPQHVKRLAEATYGKVPRRSDVGVRHRPQEPPPRAIRSLTYADPQAAQPRLQRDYLVPSYHTAKLGEAEALQVLANILGSGSNSRLYQALVVDKNLAVDASAWYAGTMLDATTFVIGAQPRANVSLPQLEHAIDGVITNLVNGKITPEELKRAKTSLIADAVYAHDSQAALARWYGSSLATGMTVSDIEAWPARIRAVTAADVLKVAREFLKKRRSVTGYLVKSAPSAKEKRS